MVSIESAPHRLEKAYSKLFSTNFKIFLQEIFNEFDGPIDQVFNLIYFVKIFFNKNLLNF